MPTHMPRYPRGIRTFSRSYTYIYSYSLGIPTFRYGHEPSNRFATWHAKFFSNAIREDFLLGICTGGIIFTRGGPGTRQEIFQAACHNHYTSEDFIRPMVSQKFFFLSRSRSDRGFNEGLHRKVLLAGKWRISVAV